MDTSQDSGLGATITGLVDGIRTYSSQSWAHNRATVAQSTVCVLGHANSTTMRGVRTPLGAPLLFAIISRPVFGGYVSMVINSACFMESGHEMHDRALCTTAWLLKDA